MRTDAPALVSLTFDDGLRCQFERAVPILDQLGFQATFFLVANTDPIHTDGQQHADWPKISWTEEDRDLLKGVVRRGHEIGAHSLHHRQPFLDNDPQGEAEGSKRWIESRLEIEVPSYCYPFYYVTDPIKNAVIRAGFRQARWGTRNSYYAAQGSLDWFGVDCRQIAKDENVGGWVRPGCWHVLTFHGVGDEQDGWEPITVAEFTRQMEELAKCRDSGAVDVITFKSSADRLRQRKCADS
jgi:peptidoglycan/xylan/chitin deacetylase (PgdA/CDA1 family)